VPYNTHAFYLTVLFAVVDKIARHGEIM